MVFSSSLFNAQPLRVLVAGHGPLLQATLQALHALPATALHVCGVVDWYDVVRQRQGRAVGYQRTVLPQLPGAAKALRLNPKALGFSALHHPAFKQRVLEPLGIHLVVLATWGDILPASLLADEATAWWNVHPSLLPRHRGPNPYAAAILAGDDQTGFSLHQVTAAVDAGPVMTQAVVPLLAEDTSETLRQRVAALVAQQLPLYLAHTVLPHWQGHGALPAGTPQEETAGMSYHTHASLPHPVLPVATAAPMVLQRQQRALHPWCPVLWQAPWGVHFAVQGVVLLPYAPKGQALPAGRVISLNPWRGQVVLASTAPDTLLLLNGLRRYSFTLQRAWPRWLSTALLACWPSQRAAGCV
jgi:methionyl-tRNA formyltransferase